jgi:hypothetical protein
MSITKLEKNKAYADGFELGYVGTNPKKVRVRFFPQFITTTNHQTSVTQKQTLANPILVAQILDGTGGPFTDRSIWAPHPKEFFAAAQTQNSVTYSEALTADEIVYFANRAKFSEIGWKSADGTPNDDPRHFGNSATQKEGELAVAGLYFLINDAGTVVRCDKDANVLNPDGTYVDPAKDPAKKAAAVAEATATAAAAEAGSTTETTMMEKVKKYGMYALYAVGGGLIIGGAVWVVKKMTKPKKGRK